MEDLVTKLGTSLEGLIRHHRRLVEVLKAERKSMVDMNVEEISLFTFNKEQLAEEIRKEDRERRVCSAQLAKRLGLSDGAGAREVLKGLEAVDASAAQKLRLQTSSLELIVDQAVLLNRANSDFISHTIRNIDSLRNAITGADEEFSRTYAAQGTMNGNRQEGPGSAQAGRLLSRQA